MKKNYIQAEEFDKKFDNGEDVLEYLDMEQARRPGLELKRMTHIFKSLIKHKNSFLLTLSFLSRLGKAQIATPEDMSRCMIYFFPVSLILGLTITLPFYLGLGQGHPFVQAWIMLCLNIYLTRGLHWDGWADIWDGLGSNTQGEKFWAIVKDSHIGAFGVIGLVLGLSGQVILNHEIAAAHRLGIVIWATILGRTAAVILAFSGRNLLMPGMGKYFLQGATPKVLALNLALTIISGLFILNFKQVVFSFLVLSPGLLRLYNLARKQKGLNGDFLGAIIIWGEISGLFAVIT